MSPRQLEEKYNIRKRTVNTWVRTGKLTATTDGAGKALRYEIKEVDFLDFIKSPAAGKYRKTEAELPHIEGAQAVDAQNTMSGNTPQQNVILPNTQSDAETESPVEPSEVRSPQQQSEDLTPDQTSQSEPIIYEVELNRIHIDPDCQVRAKQDEQVVAEYAQAMKDGAQFPPVEMFEEKGTGMFFISDGYHRIAALTELGRNTVMAHIYTGGKATAIRYALQANQSHGARRTSADKRRAISIAVKIYDELSNVEIAKICGVSESSVRNHREKVAAGQKRIGSDGKAQAAHKRTPSSYRRAKSAITRVRCTKEDAVKLIDWLRTHFRLEESEAA